MEFLSMLGEGGEVTLIGLFIVFLALAILIGCIVLMARLFRLVEKRKAQKEAAAIPAPKAPEAPAIAEATDFYDVPEPADDPKLIAAIMAAIAAFDDSGKRLVVRSVRKATGWNRASREEQVFRF